MCKISVIMPVYNAENFLEKSIESISKQTMDDLELICVDDGSTDDSLIVLNELKLKYPFLKVIEREHQGIGKTRNTGINHAEGEYIAFLDAYDIYVDENALEAMYNFAIENDANFVSANLSFIEQDYTIVNNPHYEMKDYARFNEFSSIDPEDYGIPYAFYKGMFKADFLLSKNIYFPDFLCGEDPIFLANVLTNVDEVYTVPLNLYGYNHSVGGGVNAKINTYDKKRDYLQHFHDTSEILSRGGLQDTSDFYKIHLFRYLVWNENKYDEDLFELYDEIFDMYNDSFDKTDFNYVIFNIAAKFYFVKKYDSEEFFKKVNSEFLTFNVYDTNTITYEILNKYFLIVYSYSLNDFKNNCEKFSMNNIEFKKEFFEFKLNKFLFNYSISDSRVVHKNTKNLILEDPNFESFFTSNKLLRNSYNVIQENYDLNK